MRTSKHCRSFFDGASTAVTDPTVIEKALEGFIMPMHNAETRVTFFCVEFFERLDEVGCLSFCEVNPKMSIDILLRRVQTSALKKEMRRRTAYNETPKKYWTKFLKVLSTEAVNCQVYGDETRDTPKKSAPAKHTPHGGTSQRVHKSRNVRETDKPSKQLLVCLWKEHSKKGTRHYLKDCPSCPNDVKDRLFEEVRAKKSKEAKRTS